MFKLNLKNLDNNLIGNIVIFISLILVIICFFMVITSNVTTSVDASQVEWNGYQYFLESDANVEMNTEDTLKITSPYSTHNIELKKTKDQTTFNKHFGSQSAGMWAENDYDDTHKYLSDESDSYAVIVPNDAIEMKDGKYVIKENTEFIEIIGEDPSFMMSFTSSATKVK